MDKNEVILQLTLKAMDVSALKLDRFAYDREEDMVKQSAFNAKQISDFAIAISQELFPR